MKVKDIASYLEQWAPLPYQEAYDNSGLLVGSPDTEVSGVLIALDVTEAVIEEAIAGGQNMIIAHHPLIFRGIKQITGSHWVERCIIKAIRHDIALYAIHTNLDNVHTGVNRKIAERLGLENLQVLSQKNDTLSKLVAFIPPEDTGRVLQALYAAGAGQVGNYDHCSFQLEGTGTFRPGEEAQPHIGSKNVEEQVSEKRVEVIFPSYLTSQVLKALKASHPYEEVAYYLTPLANRNQEVGSGMIGELAKPVKTEVFLQLVKERMNTGPIRHTALCKNEIKKVAVCGGAGSFLLSRARAAKADLFITGDFKYHDFFEADNQIIIADIGHYESEQFTKELLYEILSKKFTNIALRLTEVVTNPIIYL